MRSIASSTGAGRVVVAAGLILLSAAGAAHPVSLHVAPDGSGDYPTIRQAMAAATHGDTILLADGTFVGDDNHNIDFLGKAVVVRSQSGDPTRCIIDCTARDGDPEVCHRGFYFGQGEGSNSRIEGLRIVNGRAMAPCPGCRGGAILCTDGSSPAMSNCIFANNVAAEGGAVACDGSSNPILRECVFVSNQALEWAGGALSCIAASPVLEDCVFEGNQAYETGGAIFCYSLSSPVVERSRISGGVAIQGGAIYCGQASHALLTDCIISDNTAISMGGGIYCVDSSPILQGCTLHANGAYVGGGLACRFGSQPVMRNTIVSFGSQGGAVYCDVPAFIPTFECCDIFGNAGGDWTGHISSQLGQDGNLCLDPLYCLELNPEQPLTLRGSSPCAPEQSPECGLIGACPVGCEWSAAVEQPGGCPVGLSYHARCAPNPSRGAVTIYVAVQGHDPCAPVMPGLRGSGGPPPVMLSIHDVAGRVVTRLPLMAAPNGRLVAHWDGRDRHGHSVSRGVYLARPLAEFPIGQPGALALIRVE